MLRYQTAFEFGETQGMTLTTRIPVIVVTGFLGSGKTTLLAEWLREPAFTNTLVIVNEFGETGLDHLLLATGHEDPLLLENGCACCTAADSLSDTLARVWSAQLAGEMRPFQRVIIETTGLADPTAMVRGLMEDFRVASRYVAHGIVTVLDARCAPDLLAFEADAAAQLAAADVVVLSKTDLVKGGALAHISDLVRLVRPQVPTFFDHPGSRSSAQVLAALPVQAHVLNGLLDQTHALSTPRDASHLDALSSVFLPLSRPVPTATLDRAIARALQEFGGQLLRLKGLVLRPGHQLDLVQAAPNEPVSSETFVPRAEAAAPRTGLTLIVRGEPGARALASAIANWLPAAGEPVEDRAPAERSPAKGSDAMGSRQGSGWFGELAGALG